MREEIKELRSQIEADLAGISSPEDIEKFRLKHLVRKGTIASLFDRLREEAAEHATDDA